MFQEQLILKIQKHFKKNTKKDKKDKETDIL